LFYMAFTFVALAQDSTANKKAIHDVFFSGYFNHLNDGTNYGMGIAGGYYRNMYAEARYNYEDLQTASLFAGYSFSDDAHAVNWELIPMLGIAFGNTKAILPGLTTNLSYKQINFSSQNEYAFDLDDEQSNFFYSWSELTYTLKPWFEPGIVAQKSKLYKTGREIDRGFMINSNFLPKSTLSAYLFDPFDQERRFYLLGLSFQF
jgi:hypothetical protein